MNSDCDIYKDLSTSDFNTGVEIEKLQEQNNLQQELIQSLETDVEKLCAKILEMKRTRDILKQNISKLYNTAKAEIDRKDRIITDLRSQLEKVQFERRNRAEKRGRSPSLQTSLEYPVHKKVKEARDYDRSVSRSRSRETYIKSYRDEKDYQRRRENERYREDHCRRKSPVSGRSKSRHEDTKREKYGTKTEKDKFIQKSGRHESRQEKRTHYTSYTERRIKKEVGNTTRDRGFQKKYLVNLEGKRAKIKEE